MRFCFIIEEQYRNDPMPMVIADQLLQWGHDVDVLEPQAMVTCLTDLSRQGYDAYSSIKQEHTPLPYVGTSINAPPQSPK